MGLPVGGVLQPPAFPTAAVCSLVKYLPLAWLRVVNSWEAGRVAVNGAEPQAEAARGALQPLGGPGLLGTTGRVDGFLI